MKKQKSINIHDELTINLRDLTDAMNAVRDEDDYCKPIDVWKKLLEWNKKSTLLKIPRWVKKLSIIPQQKVKKGEIQLTTKYISQNPNFEAK